MKIPPFKPQLQDKEERYVDRFQVRRDRQLSVIKKEKQIDKRMIIEERQAKINKEIAEEKLVAKENNERWKQLNIVS